MDCVRIGDDHPAARENVFSHLRHKHLAMIYFTAKASTKLLPTWHLLLSGEGTTQSGFLNPSNGNHSIPRLARSIRRRQARGLRQSQISSKSAGFDQL